MPYEKQLHKCLSQPQTESQLRENLAAIREYKGLKDEILSEYVIPGRVPAIKVQKALKTMSMEYSSSKSVEDDSTQQPESSGPQMRQRLCDVFFMLHRIRIKCRAQKA